MSKRVRVLVADDDPIQRRLISYQLACCGFEEAAVAGGAELLEELKAADYDVLLLDVSMPGLSGLDVLRQVKAAEDPPEVIMLTGDTSLETGVEAMRRGAYDYVTKPARPEHLEAVIHKAAGHRELLRQNARLKAVVSRAAERESVEFVSRSASMGALVEQAERAARLDTSVLITGESGTGKDVLARFIHSRSRRADLPMVTVNCGALPDNLFESEFFGHERGAFTGATSARAGLIEAADASTLFLDEVGDMPLPAQVKLLRFLEGGRFRRVGSTRERSADVRVIAATNHDLERDVREGRFRADLFYRLNVVSLHVLPLRERREDIAPLAESFLAHFCRHFQRPAAALSPAARERIEAFAWPGNVRELRNAVERAVALCDADVIEAEDLLPGKKAAVPPSHDAQAAEPLPLVTLEEMERLYVRRVLEAVGGNRDRAATILGITTRTLYRKLQG